MYTCVNMAKKLYIYLFNCNFISPKCDWFHHLSPQYFPKFLTCLCGRVVSKSHLPTLILTCLWMSGRVLTKALLLEDNNVQIFLCQIKSISFLMENKIIQGNMNVYYFTLKVKFR